MVDLSKYKIVGKNNLSNYKSLGNAGAKGFKQTGGWQSPKQGQLAGGFPEQLKEGVKGALSTIPESAKGLLQLAIPNKAIRAGIEEALPEYKPPTRAGEIGKTVGNIAQYFIPMGGGIKGAGLLTKAGLEGAKFAGVTAAQEGELNKNVATDFALGAGIPLVGAGIKGLGELGSKFITMPLASGFINRLIKPLEKELRFGKDPARAIIENGIKANTIKGLGEKVSSALKNKGETLGNLIKASDKGKTANAENIILKIVNKNKSKITNDAVANKLNRSLDELFYNTKFTRGGLIKEGEKDLSKLGSVGIHNLQKKIGSMITWSEPQIDKPVNEILATIYRSLGKKLDQLAPNAKKLQREYADLLSAQSALIRRIAQTNRWNRLGLTERLLGGGTVGYSLLSGDSTPEALLKGLAIAGGGQFLRSTFLNTRLAQQLKNLDKIPKSKYPELLTKILAAIESNKQKQPEQGK